MTSRILNVASGLLSFMGIFTIFGALQYLINPASMNEGLLNVTNAQISAFSQNVMDLITSLYYFNGVRLLMLGVSGLVIALIPFRKAAKWAWYLMSVLVIIDVIGELAIYHIYSPIMTTSFVPTVIFVIIIYAIALILPVKEFFK